jgi:hypothetical protein
VADRSYFATYVREPNIRISVNACENVFLCSSKSGSDLMDLIEMKFVSGILSYLN